MLRVHLTDPDGNIIIDGEPVARRMTGVNWSTMWPKGYGPMGAQFKRDILTRNPVYAGCKVVLKWGGRSVYEGRLSSPQQSLSGADGSVSLSALGFYVYLAERQLRKRWIDLNGVAYLETPSSRMTHPDQTRATAVFSDHQVRMTLVPDDTTLSESNHFHLEYVLPVGTVRRVLYDWAARTGEGYALEIYNDDQAAIDDTEYMLSTTPTNGSVNHLLVQGDTGSFTFRLHPSLVGGSMLDQNDWASIIDLAVQVNYHASHSAVALPLYTTDELLEDAYLYLRETDLSADVGGLAFTGVAMTNYSTLNDGFESGDSLVQRLLRYGGTNEGDDTATFGLCVYGSDESSDGLPKAVVTPRSTADYEYVVDPSERNCRSFNPEESEAALYNYIVVQYTDESGRTRYLTPDDYSSLKDDDSIAQFGKRMPPATLNAGSCDAAAALIMGRRALAFHKDELDRMSMNIGGAIKTKAGLSVPVCYVRSGERVRVKGYKGGKTYFIRNTGFNAESQTISISSDLPPLMMDTLLNRPAIE